MASPGFTVVQRSLPTALDIDVIVDAFMLPQNQYNDLTYPLVEVSQSEPGVVGNPELRQCAPNPVVGTSRVVFSLPSYTNVRLEVLDLQGRRTRSLVRGEVPAGVHSIEWNGMDDTRARALPGVYFVQLTVDERPSGQRRLVVLQ